MVYSAGAAEWMNPECARLIPANERQYTDNKDWEECPLPGYMVSTVDHWGPLESDKKDRQPISTIVDKLPVVTHHVYLRYQADLRARLLGAQDHLVEYTDDNWERRVDPDSREVYLGAVQGATVQVDVDNAEGRSVYEGILILTQAQEDAAMAQRRVDMKARLKISTDKIALAKYGLSRDLKQNPAFDKDRDLLAALTPDIAGCRKALRKADSSLALHEAEKRIAALERRANTLLSQGEDRHSDVERAELAAAIWKKLDKDRDGIVMFPHSSAVGAVGFSVCTPKRDDVEKPLDLFACREQYESASFVLLPTQDRSNVKIERSGLHCGHLVLPASAIDIKVVDPDGLLVHNEGVKKFAIGKDGSFSMSWDTSIEPCRDTPELQPIGLRKGIAKQMLVKVHVPADQPAGVYTGKLVVTAPDGLRKTIPLSVKVMDFELPAKPIIEYGWYYFSHYPSVRNAEQTQTELNNLAAHGLKYCVIYTPADDMDVYRQMLRMMKKAGMATDKVFWATNSGWGWQEKLRKGELSAANYTKAFVRATHDEGFGDWYYYLLDEGPDDARKEEIALCKIIHENGGKTFASDNSSSGVRILKDLLDIPFLAIDHHANAIGYYHSIGHKAYAYMQPNVEPGNPYIYRRQYGYRLWQLGYDGASPFSWTSWSGEPGKKFGDSSLSMCVRVYDGLIDSLKGEGWLAGCERHTLSFGLLEGDSGRQAVWTRCGSGGCAELRGLASRQSYWRLRRRPPACR